MQDDINHQDILEKTPKPFYTHPIACDIVEMVHHTHYLNIIPLAHHHDHGYSMCNDDNMLVLLGEANSGNNFYEEYDKCLPHPECF